MSDSSQTDIVLRALFDSFGVSLFVLDPQRTVKLANAAARSLVASRRLLLIDGQDTLTARCPRAAQQLEEAVSRLVALPTQAIASGAHIVSLIATPPDGGDEVATGGTVVHVLGLTGVRDRCVVMVPQVVAADGGETPLIEVLRGLYGLTRAEGRLAAAMLRGVTNGADLARTLDRSEWTIRSQIRSLLAKLDVTTKSQAITKMSMEVLVINPAALASAITALR